MNYAPEVIGVGKYTSELAMHLAARGHPVEVVAAFPHYPSWTVQGDGRWWPVWTEEGGVRIVRCPVLARPGGGIWRLVAPVTFALGAAPLVFWGALRSRPRTILCVEPTLLAAPAALLAAWLTGARSVLHVQDLELDAAFATGYLSRMAPLAGLARRFERAMRRRFDAVVTISEAMAARLREQVPPDRVSVMRNWVHPPRPAAASTIPDLRRRLGIPDDVRLVLYAGNLGAKQGLPVLIEAARHLRADPSIRVLVVGGGMMAGAVRAAAAALPNLTSLDLLPAAQLGDLLRAADLHVLPQEKAASGLVFPSKLGPLLLSGRPIVVTAEPCSELALWLGGAALRCPPGDGRALADMIREGLRHACNTDPVRAADLAASLDAAAILPAFEHRLLPPVPASVAPQRFGAPAVLIGAPGPAAVA